MTDEIELNYTQIADSKQAWIAASNRHPPVTPSLLPAEWSEAFASAARANGIQGFEMDRAVTQEAVEWATQAVLRGAAFQTGAVENLYVASAGATRNIVENNDGWENDLDQAGDRAGDHYGDQLAAYEKVRGFVKSADPFPINTVLIREIHKIACASQEFLDEPGPPQRLNHGEYKAQDNYVVDRFGRKRWYCPAYLVEAELSAAVDVFRELEEAKAVYGVRAAYLHWAIAHIHPFQDGNGRVARTVASIPLLHERDIPLIVFADRKPTYLQALDAADDGDPKSFIDYTLARATDTDNWRGTLARNHVAQPLDAITQDIQAILAAQEEPAEPDADVRARVLDVFIEGVSKGIEDLAAAGISVQSATAPTHYGANYCFEASTTTPFETLTFMSLGLTMPDTATRRLHVRAWGSRDTYEAVKTQRFGTLELEYQDCTPSLSTEAQIRIAATVEQFVRGFKNLVRSNLSNAARAVGRLPNQLPAPGPRK